MPQAGCLLLVLMLCGLCLLPLVMLDLMRSALLKLHLSGPVATLALIGMLVGTYSSVLTASPLAVVLDAYSGGGKGGRGRGRSRSGRAKSGAAERPDRTEAAARAR